MVRKVLAAGAAVVVAMAGVLFFNRAADAAAANVSVTAAVAANGTTTLTYRATVLKAGAIREITMAIPAGTTGRVTSVNGTVSSASATVLRWRPARVTNVAVGARLAIPLYGLRLPIGGPWTLGFKAVGTAGQVLTSGAGVLAANKTYTAAVAVKATNPIPGQTTNLTYQSTITRAGALAAVRMQLPTGSTGTLSTVNGTLTRAAGYATWKPKAPLNVAAGARLAIPVNGVLLSKYGGNLTMTVSATTSTGTVLSSGSGTTAFIAPPAEMPLLEAAGSAPVPAGCPESWPTTAAENAKAGTGDWVIPPTMSGTLAAYLTEVSATCGDTVDLKVTSGNLVSVVAYRMGYYAGLGAREIWRKDNVPTVAQEPPTTGGTSADGKPLRMTSAETWTKTLSIPVDDTWVPGTYLIKVSDGQQASYAPLTVRDDTGTKHALLIQQANATWQAYNSYGGVSFYTGLDTGSGRLTSDRPYNEGQGSGQYLSLEQGLVFWAESKGLDVTYWTDNDLDQFGGDLPSRAGTVFLPGHDEYYSLRMRAALSQAIAQGVNVANLGANTAYRHITFTDSTRRAWDIDRYTDGYNSTTWRYDGDAYASQPLLGAEYICAVLGNTMTTGTGWLFDGVSTGTQLPGFVAGEIDYVWPDLYKQPGLTTLVSSSGNCRTSGKAVPMHTTAYTAPSGGRVLNGSTFAYGCFLVRRCPSNWTVPAPDATSQQAVGTMVANLTEWVSRGTIAVPADTSIASVRVAVPKYALPTNPLP
ncbi:N,N-dimethylformamidase beta subunit family domain-containing protein [Kribbella sp. NPDC026611]|uniref:N,N-dimethylformamidase beta subunit family domain-containing protein n=1 Tax=Kribbella sp. NPDC026611 TaxID=3154911 RepID=UPI0033FCD809